jgi:hypothetical protein
MRTHALARFLGGGLQESKSWIRFRHRERC